MTKAVIFDTDGMVVITDMFSVKYCEEYKVPYENILPFFKNEFQPCLVGKADLKEQIKPYLDKWNWKKSVEEFLEYWFKAEHHIDNRVTKTISRLKKSGIKCYLATNQEIYRTNYLKNEMGFKTIFDRIFSSAEIGYKKPQAEFFDVVVKEIGLDRNEIQFWDDTVKNVLGAKEVGLNAHLYTKFEEFESEIDNLLKDLVR
jgi:putative hydrolase of the HAD superfamily